MTSINAPLDSVTASVGEWLERICESSFEMIFGFWMGRHCCPFVYETPASNPVTMLLYHD